eukprot:CAMPEP_0117689202 /NCGR_PEP_ID=MMETSP0804-20121206/24332_1 /TAXON_ID=1074897 /ORGANISM="Tetraselmis astigmatica, Strain CCMP880" /LENGTH=123 /DNA_ID=CAMNT_0005501895 /DNA_START=196 /DNA_END=567 /DNA_ORIENTATION=+
MSPICQLARGSRPRESAGKKEKRVERMNRVGDDAARVQSDVELHMCMNFKANEVEIIGGGGDFRQLPRHAWATGVEKGTEADVAVRTFATGLSRVRHRRETATGRGSRNEVEVVWSLHFVQGS